MNPQQHRTVARAYQAAVAVAGISLWLWALARLHVDRQPREQMVVLALVPVIVFAGLFTQHFRIPLGLDLTRERLTFSLSDAIVLLVAYWYGVCPAIFVAGFEGFITSRRTVRRWSSNVFSFGMMSLVAASSSLVIKTAFALGAGADAQLPFHLAALAFCAASVTHNLVNMALLSTLLALRHAKPIFALLKESFLWTAPILCLPTTAAAILMHHALVVRHHHERWDGKGYPDGLQGDAIPLTARILSVVDCFDAVREDRQYRRGMTREEAIELIMQGAGTQYDPRVVGTFVTHLPEFEAEILAHRGAPVPTYGIEPAERLSAAASRVAPAAGLAEEVPAANLNLTARELSALDALAHRLEAARPDRDEVVKVFVGALADLVSFETCAVTLAAGEGEYAVAYAAGAHAELLRGRRIRQNDGVTGWALANQQPFCNTAPQLDLPADTHARFAAYRTLAAFPVTRAGHAHGALTLYSASLAEYTAEHRRLIGAAAAVLATALSPAERAAAEIKINHPSLHNSDAPASVIDGETLKLHAPLESDLTH
ncbi:MAG: GAF domain-containing protein [Acidobacteria bacterium]|nr:GAF domain-containing protein [Acidobacteriota bacterium]